MLLINLSITYITCGIGIYEFTERLDINNLTNEQEELLKLMGFIFKPIVYSINYLKIQKAIYLRNKTVKQIKKELKKIDNKINNTNDKTILSSLKADKLRKQMLISYLMFDGDDYE